MTQGTDFMVTLFDIQLRSFKGIQYLYHVINYKIGHLLQSLSEPLKLNFPPTITNHGLGPIT